MRKRFLFIFFIALLTATGILLFQLYWVYNTYKTGENNLNKTLISALEKSIETYELKENQLPASLKYKAPSLSVFMRTHPDKTIPASIKSELLNAKETFSVEYKNILINSNDLPMVKIMLARLLAQQLGKPINMILLEQIFRDELIKLNLNLNFRLVLLNNRTNIPAGHIGAYVSFLKSPTIIEANFDHMDRLLISQNFIPAIVSFMLILLSAGSLYYMGFIIRRQIQLDDMKNDFINNITHELRTPISILKTSNEALTSFGAAGDPERSERYLNINTLVLEKLDVNVERILDITQYEHGLKLAKLELIDLKETIQQVLQIFEVNGLGRIIFKDELKFNLIRTDKYMIGTIISNLVDNATKYAGEQATIEILTKNMDNGWQLTVKDNGRGIASDKLPFIFDKFYRIQDGDLHDVKGYGLGLSYVKQLVSTLKGEIIVNSNSGSGTTFKINFPKFNG
jgi:two-component system phosphate regulon sensor histidine kinase PhoR